MKTILYKLAIATIPPFVILALIFWITYRMVEALAKLTGAL